jgi:hypothetical protein
VYSWDMGRAWLLQKVRVVPVGMKVRLRTPNEGMGCSGKAVNLGGEQQLAVVWCKQLLSLSLVKHRWVALGPSLGLNK